MARKIVLDEIHLHVAAPPGLDDAAYNAAHRTLKSRSFMAELRRAIRAALLRYPSLIRVRFTLTR